MKIVDWRSSRAAIARLPGQPLTIEEVRIGPPNPDEVRVRVVACGICHGDLVARDQQVPAPLPIVLGHEGTGVVEAVGAAVTSVQPGDHVMMAGMTCGRCSVCESGHPSHCEFNAVLNFGGARLDGSTSTEDTLGQPIHDHFFGQSSFAEYAMASERNVVRVAKDLPLERLGPLGCGMQTGAGAVFDALRVPAGAVVAVFGTGAVGMAAVMAARVAGATRIIAVDVYAERLALARELGATDLVNGRELDAAGTIRQITGNRGADFAIECSGNASVLRQAIDSLAVLGTCGVLGAVRGEVAFDVNSLITRGQRIVGIAAGDSISRKCIPLLIELYRQGRFPFDRLIRFYDFEDINQAIADGQAGRVIKPVIRISR